MSTVYYLEMGLKFSNKKKIRITSENKELKDFKCYFEFKFHQILRK